jgi:hypothetical protein
VHPEDMTSVFKCLHGRVALERDTVTETAAAVIYTESEVLIGLEEDVDDDGTARQRRGRID